MGYESEYICQALEEDLSDFMIEKTVFGMDIVHFDITFAFWEEAMEDGLWELTDGGTNIPFYLYISLPKKGIIPNKKFSNESTVAPYILSCVQKWSMWKEKPKSYTDTIRWSTRDEVYIGSIEFEKAGTINKGEILSIL